MPIAFAKNDSPTIGVEMELHLVDAASGDLVSFADAVLAEMGRHHPDGEHPKAKHELFQCTVEVITGVCNSPAEAAADLASTMTELRAVTDQMGLAVFSAGTHPFAKAADQRVSESPRYHELVEAMQWPARRLLICGMHVHVAVSSNTRVVPIINELTRHLPIFLALSASSPYFEGEDSGLASARAKVFESLPTAGLPPRLADWTQFERCMTTLLDARCIRSIREIWWDIRPHPDFGTVELRMCDAPGTVADAMSLAALAQALVVWCERQLDAGTLPEGPTEWTLRENRWLAGRYGANAELIVEDRDGIVTRRPVADLVEDLIELLSPIADELGSRDELVALRSLVTGGTSSDRQRAIVESGGSLSDVVAHLVAEFAADGSES